VKSQAISIIPYRYFSGKSSSKKSRIYWTHESWSESFLFHNLFMKLKPHKNINYLITGMQLFRTF